MNNIDIDPKNFIVLLIGTSEYPADESIADVPNIDVNISELKKVFIEIIKVPEINIKTVINQGVVQINKALEQVMKNAYNTNSTLFVYYSGHGCYSEDSTSDQVYLTTIESEEKYIQSTSIDITKFREQFAKSKAKKKILVLDSCFSGKAIEGLLGKPQGFESQISIEGAYVIASSPKDKPSEYNPDNPDIPTYFTGEFIDIIKNGIDESIKLLSIGKIFDEVVQRLKQKKRNKPVYADKDDGNKIPFVYNQKYNASEEEDNTHKDPSKETTYKPVTPSIFQSEKGVIVIGLTGRTGSGCTTVAECLSKKTFAEFSTSTPIALIERKTNEERKYGICYRYLEKNWNQALHIKVTHLIMWLLLQEKNYDDFILWSKIDSNLMNKKMRTIVADKDMMDKIKLKLEETRKKTQAEETFELLINKKYEGKKNIEKFANIKLFIDTLKSHYEDLKNEKILGKKFIPIFQLFGNWLREQSLENEENKYSIVGLIHKLIHFYKYNNKHILENRIPTLIVIDALRNPYEILFLRKKYSLFYSMAISTNNDVHRKNRLAKKYNEDEIDEFDDIEYPKDKPSLREIYARQNLEKCMEISDIHIVNNGDRCIGTSKPDLTELKQQLVRYLSLMKHPGLVTPTHEERIMQIAFTAKYNSGCLSRQVGAVVTDDEFAIKTIGWNNVPEGHVSCLLRNCNDLLTQSTCLSDEYSDFEKTDIDFKDKLEKMFGEDKEAIAAKMEGRNLSYCFKDVKDDKNPVFTRALHAEENAFLQIVKHGGQGIKGGCLFTTASPCELCAKKAYQLGIRKIYYIDIYQGISEKHILESGRAGHNRPKMQLFEGAVGRAYFSLYSPIVAYKDEIYDILNIKKGK